MTTSTVSSKRRRTPRSRAWWAVGVAAALTVSAVGVSSAASSSPRTTAKVAGSSPQTAAKVASHRPNIVFVLTDDLSRDLVQYMPHVLGLQRTGTSFGNYTVTDSLCCPSRSSIFTGRFPHDTHIFTNNAPDGGFDVFHKRHEEASTFATDLQHAGYRTAMMGKYLNGYDPRATLGGSKPYVPAGWNEWDVTGNGYPEYNYWLNHNGTPKWFGHKPSDYLVDVLSHRAASFASSSVRSNKPFMLEVATFAPHAPYTPAPRDLHTFPGLRAPRGPAWDTLPKPAPHWLRGRAALTRQEITKIDTGFRKRVQAVQAVDDLIGNVEQTLARVHALRNTIIVFSSDNGYHMGQYRLNPGKMTAFDTDIRVPLVVAGPGVRRNKWMSAPTENIDLRPTFDQLGGASSPSTVDGRSMVPLLQGTGWRTWRTDSLIEHHGPDTNPSDPDHPGKNSGNPPTYSALRTAKYTYVEYIGGGREYYDHARDPHELHNIIGTISKQRLAHLHAALYELKHCHGKASCWAAGHVAG